MFEKGLVKWEKSKGTLIVNCSNRLCFASCMVKVLYLATVRKKSYKIGRQPMEGERTESKYNLQQYIFFPSSHVYNVDITETFFLPLNKRYSVI